LKLFFHTLYFKLCILGPVYIEINLPTGRPKVVSRF